MAESLVSVNHQNSKGVWILRRRKENISIKFRTILDELSQNVDKTYSCVFMKVIDQNILWKLVR